MLERARCLFPPSVTARRCWAGRHAHAQHCPNIFENEQAWANLPATRVSMSASARERMAGRAARSATVFRPRARGRGAPQAAVLGLQAGAVAHEQVPLLQLLARGRQRGLLPGRARGLRLLAQRARLRRARPQRLRAAARALSTPGRARAGGRGGGGGGGGGPPPRPGRARGGGPAAGRGQRRAPAARPRAAQAWALARPDLSLARRRAGGRASASSSWHQKCTMTAKKIGVLGGQRAAPHQQQPSSLPLVGCGRAGRACSSPRAGVVTTAARPRRASHASSEPRPTLAGAAGGSSPSRLRVHGPAVCAVCQCADWRVCSTPATL